MSRPTLAILFFSSLASFAADYLPLAAGNRWVYRSPQGQTWTISVGTPLAFDGRVYYRVTGYAPRPEWVRRLPDGALVTLNEETGEDQPLIAFDRTSGWHASRLSACEQEARPAERPVAHRGPAGQFAAALELTFRSYICVDAGIQSERYVDNLGLLRRVTTSLAGEVPFDLVYARVGNAVVTSDRGGAARVELPAAVLTRTAFSEPVALQALLRVSVDAGEPVRLRFGSAQRTDFALYDDTGREVYRWSERLAFTQVAGEELLLGDRAFPLAGVLAGLPDGRYMLAAWLATERPSFAAASMFELKTEPAAN